MHSSHSSSSSDDTNSLLELVNERLGIAEQKRQIRQLLARLKNTIHLLKTLDKVEHTRLAEAEKLDGPQTQTHLQLVNASNALRRQEIQYFQEAVKLLKHF